MLVDTPANRKRAGDLARSGQRDAARSNAPGLRDLFARRIAGGARVAP